MDKSERSTLRKNDSAMRGLIYEKDWSETPLGKMENWPAPLLNITRLILDHKFPNVLVWGKELIMIYNDAYRPILGDKPEALGRPFLEVWSEASKEIKPQIDKALDGEPYYVENKEFTLKRYGKPEKAWFDYSYCPVRDTESNVSGILITAVEKTDQITSERELKELNETLEKRVKKRTVELKAYQNQLRLLASELNKDEQQERHRLAGELHDHLGQLLALSKINLERLQKTDLSDSVSEQISDIKELIIKANEYTSELVAELKPPPIVHEQDIEEILSWIANKMGKHGLKVSVNDDEQPKPLSKEVKITLYQCVRELLFNIIKHAGVNQARLQLSRFENQIQISVEDSGQGFNVDGKSQKPTKEGGFGLFNIQERINLLGGNLNIDSKPGEGTKATLRVPLENNSGSTSQINM